MSAVVLAVSKHMSLAEDLAVPAVVAPVAPRWQVPLSPVKETSAALDLLALAVEVAVALALPDRCPQV